MPVLQNRPSDVQQPAFQIRHVLKLGVVSRPRIGVASRGLLIRAPPTGAPYSFRIFAARTGVIFRRSLLVCVLRVHVYVLGSVAAFVFVLVLPAQLRAEFRAELSVRIYPVNRSVMNRDREVALTVAVVLRGAMVLRLCANLTAIRGRAAARVRGVRVRVCRGESVRGVGRRLVWTPRV